MQRKGVGSAAIVVADMEQQAESKIWWTTGRFGVLPSGEGQVISIGIFFGRRSGEDFEYPLRKSSQGRRIGSFACL